LYGLHGFKLFLILNTVCSATGNSKLNNHHGILTWIVEQNTSTTFSSFPCPSPFARTST
jgi:hypothetical protein